MSYIFRFVYAFRYKTFAQKFRMDRYLVCTKCDKQQPWHCHRIFNYVKCLHCISIAIYSILYSVLFCSVFMVLIAIRVHKIAALLNSRLEISRSVEFIHKLENRKQLCANMKCVVLENNQPKIWCNSFTTYTQNTYTHVHTSASIVRICIHITL